MAASSAAGGDVARLAAREALSRAATGAGPWPEALIAVADYVGADGAMLLCNDVGGGGSWLIGGRLDEALTPIYLARHVANPTSVAAMRKGPGVYLASELTDFAAVLNSDLGREVLAPQGIRDVIQLVHRGITDRSRSGGIGVSLSRRQAEDGAARLQRMNRLRADIDHALDLWLSLARADLARRGATAALEALPGAALILDARFHPVLLNARAEAMLERRGGGELRLDRSGRLAARLRDDDARLLTALRAACAEPGGVAARMILEGSIVAVSPVLAGDRWLAPAAGGSGVLVRCVDPSQELGASVAALAALYRLSPAEARVLECVAAGLAAPASARRLGVATSTVKSQLAQIFRRTGARSQSDLVRLLAMTPAERPLLSSLGQDRRAPF